jgi:microcystin-dependent protein
VGTPYLGEVKVISWNFPPKGWAFCNGQLMPINQNQALFSILGTNFGGDGRVTFGLPDLRGRTPVHTGGPIGAIVGQHGGEEFHILVPSEMPTHSHILSASQTQGDVNTPSSHVLARDPGMAYRPQSAGTVIALNPAMIGNTGGSQAHENRQPYLVLNFVIALSGIFPSRN